ncbi:hypothetical protein V502_06966 [Pseudogymnoascus sp. VKM F-4520 (FW-2644)]|nr:hypothetical protein V502_06966 [Pseudogymnoascus sp. VKM F-4520 (FW-2644)]
MSTHSSYSDSGRPLSSQIVSLETLIYVGLSSAKANELWVRWSNWPPTGPRRETDPDDGFGYTVTFLDFIIGGYSVENTVDTAAEDDLEWRRCLDACGINTATQDTIMDPKFRKLRLSNSCLYRARDTIEMRYKGLENLQQQSTAGIEADVWGSPNAIAALDAPGYTTLYKAMDQARIARLFDQSGAVSRIETLLTSAPSDSSGTRSLFYFTPDHAVAEYHAAYAKRRAYYASIVIICLRIPNAEIETLAPPDIQRIFFPSNEWKELVWRSRTRRPLPPHLKKYREATLVVGTTACKADLVYDRMKTWEEITEENVFRVGKAGQENGAIQYVFSGEEDGHEFLTQHARGVKVFPYPPAALEEFLANASW